MCNAFVDVFEKHVIYLRSLCDEYVMEHTDSEKNKQNYHNVQK